MVSFLLAGELAALIFGVGFSGPLSPFTVRSSRFVEHLGNSVVESAYTEASVVVAVTHCPSLT